MCEIEALSNATFELICFNMKHNILVKFICTPRRDKNDYEEVMHLFSSSSVQPRTYLIFDASKPARLQLFYDCNIL
jgi:hypothetical protein